MRAHRPTAVVALAVGLLLAGCFNPKLEPGFTCGDDPPGPACPDGFFCDQVTYTCLRNGTSPTTPGVALGAALPNLVAARLGDGVMVAGFFLNPYQQPEFQVLRFNSDGTTMFAASPQPTLNGVDQGPDGVKAAGAAGIGVIAARVPGNPDRLMRLWVSASSDTIATGDEGEATAYAVAASRGRACFVRAFPGTAGVKAAELVCHDGSVASSPWQVSAVAAKPFQWVAAAVTDNSSDDVVLTENSGVLDLGVTKNEILAFCSGGASPTSLDRAVPAPTASFLRPEAVRAPDGTAVWAGWLTAQGLVVNSLAPNCAKGSPFTFPMKVARFAVAAGSSSGAAAGIKGMSLGGSPIAPTAEDWPRATDHGIVMDPLHPFLDSPHAVSDGLYDTWFLFYASDGDERQGWIKGASWNNAAEPVVAVASDSGTVTADFAAAPRRQGGFYLAFRDNPDGLSASQPLAAYLAVVDQDLTVLRPPSP